MSANHVSLCACALSLIALTIIILELLLHNWVIDIRVDLEFLQMLRHAVYPPLLTMFILRLHRCSLDPIQPGSLHLDLLQLFLAIRLQDLSRFLEALVWELLEWDLALCLKRGTSSSTADWCDGLLTQKLSF